MGATRRDLRAILLLSLFGLITNGGSSAAAQAAGELPLVRIGVVIDGPWERNAEVEALFQSEILDLTRGEFDVRFPPDKTIIADWTLDGVRGAMDQLLSDPEVDLVLAMGVLTSHNLCCRVDLDKPMVATFVIDREIQGLPYHDGASGVPNLSYVTSPSPLERDLRAFRELVGFGRITVVISQAFFESVPDLTNRFWNAAREVGVTVKMVPVSRTVDHALAQLTGEDQAAYIAPLLDLTTGEFERLTQGLIERKLPSFSLFGRSEVERGVLAGLRPETSFERRARRVALNVQRILLGEDAGTIPVDFPLGERLVINMATARAIGFHPRWETLTEAELLNEGRAKVMRRLTLDGAVREGVATNLDLAVQDRTVAAGFQEILRARSGLLPRVDIGARGRIIDSDRAEASSGNQAERTLSGSATLEQVVYSEATRANLSIQEHIQETRLRDRDSVRLDIAQATATTYLNLLRAKTLERIQKDNLKLTRSNLELSEVRLDIGVANPAEVFRWESQIATDRKAVIDAEADRRVVEVALNQVLHRPLEELFETEEVGLTDAALITADPRIELYVSDPWSFRVFRDFMVREGLQAAPELAALDAAIAAQERALVSAKRAFWSPTVGFTADVTHLFAEGGEGTEPPAAVSLPEANDTDWTLALNASLPLYSGGSRRTDRDQAWEELGRLRIQRAAVAEQVDQRIRSALHLAGASNAGIRLSRRAAEAAQNNLRLVVDAYSRGVVSILELLDAQNAALVAEQVAANAVFDFLIDLMEVERAAARFGFFVSPDDRDTWFERLAEFFRTAEARER